MIKITENSKLYIWGSSPDVLTGGAEILNFLAAYLKNKGAYAKMFNWAYYSYVQSPTFKEMYNIDPLTSIDEISDSPDNIILLPEIMIENLDNLNWFVNYFKHTNFLIWWLNTGFNYKDASYKTSKRKMFQLLNQMKDRCLHLCESELAMRDCLYYGAENRLLFQHPVNKTIFTHPVSSVKERAIMYNGLKHETTEFVEKYIKPNLPNETFLEINPYKPGNSFLSKAELCNQYYDKAKVYIDFNTFEGREMMPREAILRDCVVFVNDVGIAETFDDYPLPNYYKIDTYNINPQDICSKILYALDNYDKCLNDLSFFKQKCLYEPMKWEWEAEQLFGPMYDKSKLKNLKN